MCWLGMVGGRLVLVDILEVRMVVAVLVAEKCSWRCCWGG